MKKTQVMFNIHSIPQPIQIDNHQLEQVDNYIYLGRMVTMDDNINIEILNRTKLGWRAFDSILPLRTSTEENQNVAPHQDATQENHCDSRILSNFDKGQTVNIPNTICISIKPTKSYGIPGHGPTVGSLVLDPIGSDVGF
ncbi:unnamed protein product [Rotaria magnacalcarata]